VLADPRRASLRSRLAAREPLLGTIVALGDPALAEMTASGYDLVWLDAEHGALGVAEVQRLAIAARAAGAHVLARLPGPAPDRLPALLDAGVEGVVVPQVTGPEEVRELVERLRYPPRGRRGFGPRRSGDWGRVEGLRPRLEADLTLWVQVETAEAVQRAEEIARVDGVDVVMATTADLSVALGAPLDLGDPAVRAAVQRVRDAARGAGRPFGVAAFGDPDGPAGRLAAGADVLVWGSDVRCYAQAAAAARGAARTLLAAR